MWVASRRLASLLTWSLRIYENSRISGLCGGLRSGKAAESHDDPQAEWVLPHCGGVGGEQAGIHRRAGGNESGGETPADFEAQVKQTFENLKAAVEAAGGKVTDIVKLSYYLDGSHVTREMLPKMRAIRDTYIDPARPPVSTAVFVKELVRAEWWIEVDAVAVVSTKKK